MSLGQIHCCCLQGNGSASLGGEEEAKFLAHVGHKLFLNRVISGTLVLRKLVGFMSFRCWLSFLLSLVCRSQKANAPTFCGAQQRCRFAANEFPDTRQLRLFFVMINCSGLKMEPLRSAALSTL